MGGLTLNASGPEDDDRPVISKRIVHIMSLR